jgi:SMI1 / KNR4 family (SUKH-1)
MYADAVASIITSGLAAGDEIAGCSEAEIRALEAAFGRQLPANYRAFLSVMGKGAGEFMRGTDMFHEHLGGLREAAGRLIAQSRSPAKLSASDWVFAVHQGYQLLYFDAAAGPDPKVFHVMEGEPAQPVAASFSDWLFGAIEDEIDGR